MKTLKSNFGGVIICIFEIVVGILLLINPIAFTSGIIIVAGIVIAATGIGSVVKYFRTDVEVASVGQPLAKGIGALLLGAFCVFKSSWFVDTFPLLTMLYGLALLIIGLSKIQLTADMLRKKNKKWYLAAIAAFISSVCAVIILSSPFATTKVLWMFTGISLIVEALADAVTILANRK